MNLPLTDLSADCSRCFGLCCVAPAFAASADFAINKPAETPCQNLRQDFGCGIHSQLRERGFPGCAVFDCFGAGQHISQQTFGGRDWRAYPENAKRMFAVFPVMRQLHELLWYLTEALGMQPAGALQDQLRAAVQETSKLTELDPDSLADLDVAAHREQVNVLLRQTSEQARAGVRQRGKDRAGADLIGAKLRGADLRGVSLRGAYLIGADLREANLGLADLTGADLRGADLGGADLSAALFLAQAQLDAARGDAATKLPAARVRPATW